MSESVLSNTFECYICKRGGQLERHHVFNGNPNRRLSEKYGAWVYLCPECHREVHKWVGIRRGLKREAQEALMESESWTEEDFRKVFGKNYL